MTCIVALKDKNSVWIGADSLGSNLYTKAVQSMSKVVRHETFKNVLMGFTCSFRHIDILRYDEEIFNKLDWYENRNIDHKYMVTKFIPKLQERFEKEPDKETKEAINFIVATDNEIFEIQSDYAVLVPKDGYCSVGCGEDIALGSLYTTRDLEMTPQERIIKALEAAENVSCGVQRPFVIMNTNNIDESIIID